MKINMLLEAEALPKVLLVQKRIWLNFKSDDATPIGWQVKQGMNPANARGLMVGDLLIGPDAHSHYPIYNTVVDQNGEVIKSAARAEFLKKELAELISSKVLKVLVK